MQEALEKPPRRAGGGGVRWCYNCGTNQAAAFFLFSAIAELLLFAGQRGHFGAECTSASPAGGMCYNCKATGHIRKVGLWLWLVGGRPAHAHAHLPQDCPMPRSQQCFNCLQEGHQAKDCAENKVKRCYTCGDASHLSKDCPSAEKKCYACNGAGHFSKDCPTAAAHPAPAPEGGRRDGGHREGGGGRGGGGGARPPRGPRTGACYTCGNAGHIARDVSGAFVVVVFFFLFLSPLTKRPVPRQLLKKASA